MSIKVENLTKFYGSNLAVDNISFDIKSGEIVGFLGPNGAGKTTTLKMITTYLAPTSG
ncbi:MAG TPA: ATP-binding cassette domain-containing protein, partial [Ignavibacteria bacterium]|nr:ATP-binding cassette domain-containing protein [Ignavibacteria bacterium]